MKRWTSIRLKSYSGPSRLALHNLLAWPEELYILFPGFADCLCSVCAVKLSDLGMKERRFTLLKLYRQFAHPPAGRQKKPFSVFLGAYATDV